MGIQRIATSPAELTTFGGTYNSSDLTKFDSSRTQGVFEHGELQLSTLNFPAVSGDTTWIHFEHAIERAGTNPQFWGESILEVKDSNDRRMMFVEIVPTMLWTAYADSGSSTAQAAQQILSDGLTISVDIKIVVGANIDVEVYFNSALQGTSTIVNTQGATNPDRIQFGIFDSSTGSVTETPGSAWFGGVYYRR